MRKFKFAIDVPIGPDWANASQLRNGILNCLACVFSSSDFCETIGMVVSELVENAIKYGDWSRAEDASFSIRVHVLDSSVLIEVSNPVATSDKRVDELLRMCSWIRSQESPASAYRNLLEQAAQGKQSGLGLGRISYETGVILEAHMTANDVLCVRGSFDEKQVSAANASMPGNS